ncbi:hypothetical protein HDU83_009833 [Entophlyctis luteolus]|nr:hypothetical protein HDU83_009833 [Entophlyctis luteolus]
MISIETAITVLIYASIVTALPGGAPKCRITDTTIMSGHHIAGSDQGFTLTAPVTELLSLLPLLLPVAFTQPNRRATYTAGGTAIAITVNNAQPTSFKGILAYVSVGATQDSTLTAMGLTTNPPMHVGAFQNISALGLRAQTNASCSAQSVVNEVAESTITHSSPLKNAITPFTLMWQPPAADEGTVTVNMVISIGTKKTPYQILQSVQISGSSGTTAVDTAVANAATSTIADATVTNAANGKTTAKTKKHKHHKNSHSKAARDVMTEQ